MNWFYKTFYTDQLKKECSGIGFLLFVASLVMTFATVIITTIVSFIDDKLISDNSVNFLMSNIVSIVSIFLVGIIYCRITKTNISTVIPLKNTKPSLFFPLIAFGLAATFIANYLGSLFYSAVALFGLTTDLNVEYGKLNPLEIFLYALSTAIIPALVEEFTFRGIILGKLREYGNVFAVFISALLFGMMHGNIVQIPFAFLIGLVLGFITVKADSLLPAMIIHFFNNFISVLFSVLDENKIFGDNLQNIIYLIIMIFILAIGILSLAYLSKNKSFFRMSDNTEILTFKEKTSACFSNVGIIIFTGYVILNTVFYIIYL